MTRMIEVSEDALNSIKAMAEQDAKDAARYRWLRENNGTWQVQVAIMHKEGDDCNWVHAMDGLDVVIDAAMQAKP